MVESKTNAKQQLLKSQAIQNVLECFDIPELLELRLVNKKIGDELIPMCFKTLKYNCPDDEEEDEEYTFYKSIKNASKVEISNISGNEAHLKKLKEIADNVGKNVRYLFLNFDGDTDSDDLAKQYVDMFRQFDSLDTLRFEVYEDGNLTKILAHMMKDENFPWFEKVRTLKCYLIRDMKDKGVLQTFFTKFRNLEMVKGIIEDEFNPLEHFPKEQKHFPKLSWTIPEVEALREKTIQFLEYNKCDWLQLHGGSIDKIEIPTLHQQYLRHLILRDMPQVGLNNVFNNLPELQTLHIDNVDDFTKDMFLNVCNKLSLYQGLVKLGLELVVFDLEECKEQLLSVMKLHSTFLRHVSFAKNKCSNSFIQFICEGLQGINQIESINLLHLKEAKNVDWVKLLESIALLSKDSKKNILVNLSGYQTHLKQKEIHAYLEQNVPFIEINIE